MKASGQRKRKVGEVSEENRKSIGAVAKKSANGSCKRRPKPAGECKLLLPKNDLKEKPSTTAHSPGETTKVTNPSNKETAKVQNVKVQKGDSLTSSKIKLQLFPVNSMTRLKLEKDGHNPFLELTLSVQKKVSSVIKHLNTKWGCSSAALGELMLFPYDVRLENIASSRSWTSDCGSFTAGELHEALETPSIFRLKYGWFTNLHVEACGVSLTSTAMEEQSESKHSQNDCSLFSRMTHDQRKTITAASQGIQSPINMHEEEDVARTKQMPTLLSVDHVVNDVPLPPAVSWDDSFTSLSIGGLLSEASLLNKINNPTEGSDNKSNLQPIELVSDISIGALLSEASLLDKINNHEQRSCKSLSFQLTQPVSDSCRRDLMSGVSYQCNVENPDLKAENEKGYQPVYSASEIVIGGLQSEESLQGKINAFDAASSRPGPKPTMENGASQFLFPWDDSMISLSIGGLLSEASLQRYFSCCNPKSKEAASSVTLNSSEPFAASQLNLHTPAPKSLVPDSFSSILDAEETCHAFSFENLSSSRKKSMTSDGGDKSKGSCNAFKSKTSTPPHTNELDEPSQACK
ncbi:uncharacterized protein [Coffea arabica]|uniref:Uncharacterized protein isoform X1 n=1 Tax=Coffea arabica TaxID=13443 RepID=A0A6P6TFI8_COFAR|nr:TSL-kinase interacting protein 1-like isoform X1 [Coffea arabica]XP_027077264.1 TSL-kinase interacting protein 1-like isoform X1 [Coffea arabica]